ncbi:MAG TPA: hypothetical protein DDW50_21005 [Firmicutes bacterium]|jgi:hypothetical protein|nr:hypothetical protein [Bacillota bacterium]
MIDSFNGPQDDTVQAITHIDLQHHAGSLLGDPPAADPNPAPAPAPNPAPADPPTPEPTPADPPKPTEPEPKPGDPPKDPGKTDPEKKEPEKPEGVPEKYEFTAPEGMVLNEANTEKVTGLFKELNLTNEQAQKLVNAEGDYLKEVQKSNEAEWNKTTEGWKDETLKAYGNNWDKEKIFGAKFRDQFIDKETADFMDKMGLFNHPGIVKMMINGGHALAEDHLEEGSKTHVKSDKEVLEEFYAKSLPKK